MSFSAPYNCVPPAGVADLEAGDAFDETQWTFVDFPEADDSTYTDVADWVPTTAVGMYYFEGSYILAYLYDVLDYSDTTEYDTWMATYDGWALGVYFYQYDTLYVFDLDYYSAFMTCVNDYCVGIYEGTLYSNST